MDRTVPGISGIPKPPILPGAHRPDGHAPHSYFPGQGLVDPPTERPDPHAPARRRPRSNHISNHFNRGPAGQERPHHPPTGSKRPARRYLQTNGPRPPRHRRHLEHRHRPNIETLQIHVRRAAHHRGTRPGNNPGGGNTRRPPGRCTNCSAAITNQIVSAAPRSHGGRPPAPVPTQRKIILDAPRPGHHRLTPQNAIWRVAKQRPDRRHRRREK